MRTWYLTSLLVFWVGPLWADDVPEPPGVEAGAWMLTEYASGQVLTAFRPEKRIEPASLTKIMTAYVVFTALARGEISLTEQVTVPDEVTGIEGSKMFLSPRQKPSIEQLLRGLIIVSGNDAAKLLAIAVAGSQEAFVERMNQNAARLGMSQSRFVNPSGLPQSGHYSSARDLSLLTFALIRDFPSEYQRYYGQQRFTYAGTTQNNRNRLLFSDPSVDGVKTGHADRAGFHLISSANRQGRRLLLVLIGAVNDKARASYSASLLDWGYSAYRLHTLYAKEGVALTPSLWFGDRAQIRLGFPNGLALALPSPWRGKLEARPQLPPRLEAPINRGQIMGKLQFYSESGRAVSEVPLFALDSASVTGTLGHWWDQAKWWLHEAKPLPPIYVNLSAQGKP